MKAKLKNLIKKADYCRSDFNALLVTNLFSKKDVEAHWNPDVKTSKKYSIIRDLFSEEFSSTESYVEDGILYFRFNNADFEIVKQIYCRS